MSKNNNKQTLFRFVSLRNPNLTETENTNLKFIHREDGLNGVFDHVVASETQTKFQALLLEASKFQATAIKSVEELEKGPFGSLIKIGKSISDQTDLSTSELDLCKGEYVKLDQKNLITIWDNFIYQYLTQKDFYVKETLAYILKALHIGYVQTLEAIDEFKKINGDDFVKTGLNATIVIPASILGEETSLTTKRVSSSKTDTLKLSDKEASLLAIDAEKFEKEQNALAENESLEQLKSEIKAIKNKYWAGYEKAYKDERNTYEKEHGANIKAYAHQMELIDELEENNASEEEIAAAYKELEKYIYPEFEFSYKEELNWDDIYNQLSEDSLAYFLDNFANAEKSVEKEVDLQKSEVKVADSSRLTVDENAFTLVHNSYDDIVADIDNQVVSNNNTVLTQNNLPQNDYVNVGGVVVPVSDTTTYTPHLSYILRARKRGFFGVNRGYVTLQVHVENASWSVSNAVVSATTSIGAHSENISQVNVVNNKLNFPTFLRNKIQGISSLTVQIFFSNGREATLQLSTVTINSPYTGILRLKPIDILDDPIDANPDEPTSTVGKHFGLKRLGVAEYMKVTQSVHAYVPGEVSNIENVMASELRHKSINELTRSEETITTSESQEIEKISDTTKVDRAEMQTEVAKELDKQRSFEAHANFTYDAKAYKFETGVGYATTNAQHISNRHAVAKSQEITERAMERVQSKISEERISKIIQEVSLTNVHEYDNRRSTGDNAEAPQHITGVYRWVDKKMKNQIYNYGKRTMFEFMIPEPAKLHRLAIATAGHTLTAPVDPRKATAPHKMSNATTATTSLLQYWADKYGVQLTSKIPSSKQIIHNATGRPNTDGDFTEISSIQIPESYIGKNASFRCRSARNRGGGWEGSRYSRMTFPNLKGGVLERSYRASINFDESVSGLNINGDVQFDVSGHNVDNYNVKVTVNCEVSQEYINAWKLENFNAIIEAYQAALDAHNEEVAAIEAEQKAKEEEQKDVMGNFYRIIEGDILKHNCIAYLLQNYLTTLGQAHTNGYELDSMKDFRVIFGEDLDKYTAKAKFLEQAFEWSIKDYTFYPYFWADRREWQTMYLSENTDTLFRSFLQSGLARVIVTVKPGFEEAVQYFLETGKVWMGGETPVIGDPLYMSIAQEMQEPTGVPQGNYWITRIPTTLTILQAHSAGLKVVQALPIFPEDEPENCENPEQLETETPFELHEGAQLSGTGNGETTLYSK